jgi:hypothetical protein
MAKADSKVDDKEKDVEEVDEETQDESEDEETEDNEEQETEEESEEEDSESDEDEEETDNEEDEKFKKRYTQIKGDTAEEYIPNLEEAYKNSSAEAVRLKQKAEDLQKQVDNISALVATNPELAEQIKEGKAPALPTDPALLRARQDMEAQNKKEYADFVDGHPELESDAELQKQVFDEIRDFAEVAAKKNRVLGMKEALNMAYVSLGLQTGSKEEAIRMKAKETAARGKSAGAAKKAKAKTEFTEAQINAGIQMGLGKTRQEVIKKLATYA